MKGKPEASLTREGAESIARDIADLLENQSAAGDCIADFVLLLRYFAFKATRDDAETIYIETEKAFAVNFDGVEDAMTAHMQKQAELYARRAKKGGAG